MPKPHFIFSKFPNSIKVDIPNLEELDVPTIQAVEKFVQERKGYFDFNTYSFVLQKRIEYEEFEKILQVSELDATSEYRREVESFQPRVSFGQYKGVFYSELPDSYLLWLKNNYMGRDRGFIEAELKSRKL